MQIVAAVMPVGSHMILPSYAAALAGSSSPTPFSSPTSMLALILSSISLTPQCARRPTYTRGSRPRRPPRVGEPERRPPSRRSRPPPAALEPRSLPAPALPPRGRDRCAEGAPKPAALCTATTPTTRIVLQRRTCHSSSARQGRRALLEDGGCVLTLRPSRTV